ncbi:MAG TPA: autotransporter assembly complex family protein [Rhodoferax sp.]|nr:autotransporter assembly complex family protein [Rhodoferax sp.]
MKWLAVMLLLACTAASAQGLMADAPANAAAASQSLPDAGKAAFVLDIIAPDEIKQTLERHLDLQRYRTLTDLTDEELDRLLDQARLDARNLIATLGYFSPVIDIERLPPGDAAASQRVSIKVTVGAPVQVSEVQLRFVGPIATDLQAAEQRQLIQESWSLSAGSRFTQARWSDAKQQALRQLTTRRYPAGSVTQTLADIDPVTRQVRLELTLESGPAYQLGELVVTGLGRFDADLVRRLARIPVGADYDQAALVQAQQRLTESGFFSSAFVSIDTRTDPQAARVLVALREAKLQKIVVGVGASTDSGARVSVEHLHNQLPWLGWNATSKLSVDRETQYIGTSLTAPPDERGWRWNTLALLLNQTSGSFDVASQRLRAGASKETERIDRSYYLQFDRADSAATDLTEFERTESITANYSFTLRSFNAMPFPTGGWAWGLELGGGTTLGSENVPFGRVLTRWQNFWQLGSSSQAPTNRHAGRLSLRGQVGAVVAKDGASLPATQLFLAGGDNSVRGYSLRSIGTDLKDGQVSAGRYMVVGSLEWQHPITRNGVLTEWESVLFVDAGAVADRPADLQAKVGVGAGARWKSPVGPLQIDLAYGVDDRKWRLHMNLGFSF